MVPDGGFDGSKGSYRSQLTTFVFWSPPKNASIPVKTGGVLMLSRWGFGGQEVPDGGLDGSTGSYGSQLTTFVFWSPPRNASIPVKNGHVLMPSRWSCGGHGVPDGVSCNSTCPEDVFSLLQNSNCFSLSQIMLDTFAPHFIGLGTRFV